MESVAVVVRRRYTCMSLALTVLAAIALVAALYLGASFKPVGELLGR